MRQGDHERGAKALDAMKERPKRPVLDGMTALRSVGEWQALQARRRCRCDPRQLLARIMMRATILIRKES